MIFRSSQSLLQESKLLPWLVVPVTLAFAIYFGMHVSILWLLAPAAAFVAVLLLRRPALGLPLLVLTALFVPVEFGTGTEVKLNAATLLLIALLGLWVARMCLIRGSGWKLSRVDIPLLLFLVAGLISFAVGRIFWDPAVPLNPNFWLVQLAQWAIFALSAGAFWLAANHIGSEESLRELTRLFLVVAGAVAILQFVPEIGPLVKRYTTIAFIRAPFWVLLTSLAGGQLLFNRQLSGVWRLFLVAVLLATLYFGFVVNRESSSTWVGVGASLGVLVWLRFSRLRWLMALSIIILIVTNILWPAVWEFAGGAADWNSTGVGRLILIRRVVEVTLQHNPITGLGPAAYRNYAAIRPLAIWIDPRVSSHNNYVDLFSQTGVLGVVFFLYFVLEVAREGFIARTRYPYGFAAGYVNGMMAAGAGALVIMMLADWMLPFVYNIGFPGFQASVLVWLFMGGLVAIDRTDSTVPQPQSDNDT